VNNVHVLAAIPPIPLVRRILSATSNNVISITRRGTVTDGERDAGYRRQCELYSARWDNALKSCQPLREMEAQLDSSEFWARCGSERR